MITILGSKVSFFTLYGLISLQLIVIGCLAAAIKLGTRTDKSGNFPFAMPFWIAGPFFEIVLLIWMAQL